MRDHRRPRLEAFAQVAAHRMPSDLSVRPDRGRPPCGQPPVNSATVPWRLMRRGRVHDRDGHVVGAQVLRPRAPL
jgi:hypothetical protein